MLTLTEKNSECQHTRFSQIDYDIYIYIFSSKEYQIETLILRISCSFKLNPNMRIHMKYNFECNSYIAQLLRRKQTSNLMGMSDMRLSRRRQSATQ